MHGSMEEGVLTLAIDSFSESEKLKHAVAWFRSGTWSTSGKQAKWDLIMSNGVGFTNCVRFVGHSEVTHPHVLSTRTKPLARRTPAA